MDVVDGRRSVYYRSEPYFPDDHVYDGKLRGLVDGNGKQILAPIFADIVYVGNGLYTATETDPHHHYHFSARKQIFNNDGRKQTFKLPSGSRLFCVLSLGEVADRNISKQIDRLPKNTFLCCANERKLGACDLRGKLIVPIRYQSVELDKQGGAYFSFVSTRTGQMVHDRLDFKSGNLERVEAKPQEAGSRNTTQYLGDRGRLTNTKTVIYTPIGPDRWLATHTPETELFDKEYWSARRTNPIPVLEMFGRFVRDNNLVGMTDDQVYTALGEPDSINPCGYSGDLNSMSYHFATGGCGGSAFGVRVYLTSGRVTSWALFSGKQESSRVRANGPLETLQPQLGLFKFPGVQYPMLPDNE
jgi:hypothetical protein